MFDEIALGLWDIIGLVVGAAALILLLAILLFEYSLWRRRRLMRVLRAERK